MWGGQGREQNRLLVPQSHSRLSGDDCVTFFLGQHKLLWLARWIVPNPLTRKKYIARLAHTGLNFSLGGMPGYGNPREKPSAQTGEEWPAATESETLVISFSHTPGNPPFPPTSVGGGEGTEEFIICA